MRINTFDWKAQFVEKLLVKHGVATYEVEELFFNKPQIRKVEKGRTKGEDVYRALGRTNDGRYLLVIFIFKSQSGTALPVSARDMTVRERKQHGR